MNIPPIDIKSYKYPLPDDRIARFPLADRDASRLLICRGNSIEPGYFKSLASHVPAGSMLVFNNTRVIRARLIFHKPGGARIEIFCLQPEGGYGQRGSAIWKCMIGNARKWKSGLLTRDIEVGGLKIELSASLISKTAETTSVRFDWTDQEMPFEQLLEYAGSIPLPPYLNREVEMSDNVRYQTIYAQHNGSVAAPTAGLHFTPAVMESLESAGCTFEYLTLHVGAGTFRPVSVADAREHHMHEEELIVERSFLLRLLQYLDRGIIPVGTTSMRSLESIYWLGAALLQGKIPGSEFYIGQWEPYSANVSYPAAEAIQAVIDYMKTENLQSIRGFTGIMIVPGYQFRICNALVTNFHQPQSTLLLLVAAFAGEIWKNAYEFALENDFRFLSYGDSCLFFRNETN